MASLLYVFLHTMKKTTARAHPRATDNEVTVNLLHEETMRRSVHKVCIISKRRSNKRPKVLKDFAQMMMFSGLGMAAGGRVYFPYERTGWQAREDCP